MTNEIFQIVISVALVVVFIVQLALLMALYRLVAKVMSLVEQTRVKADPVVEQTRQLLTSAKPIIEKAQTAAEAIAPILTRTQELLGVARETTALVRDTTATLKTEAQACLAAVTATTQELSRLTSESAQEVSALVKNTSEQLRTQVDTYAHVASRTALRIDDTVATIQQDVLRPVHEISAMLSAARTFLSVLIAPERKTVDRAYHDEEMFI
ncbi:MAG: hypothetical protein CFK52_10015 [Chloracidobacterium sp. CP2_5A]|nr:MAG: hypothetical protein CFK52_10015 [Chloracidobacterium sp. CP2_5A]